MPRHVSLLLLLPLILPGVLAAQSHPLAGDWEISIPVGASIENGVATQIFANGAASFGVEGDSIIGTLKVEPPPGYPARPPARLASGAAAVPSVFVVNSQATIDINGEESTRKVTSTYTMTAKGDALEGTVKRVIEGGDVPQLEPQTFRGKRVKSGG
jgi:hypothetical protein